MRMWPILISLLVWCGCAKKEATHPTPPTPPTPAQSAANSSKVLMIVAHQDFRDEELTEPRRVLEEAGCAVEVASSAFPAAKGMLGLQVPVNLLVKDANVADYGAVVFVGGPGAEEYWEDPAAQQIARDAVAQDKVLGAICLAPVTLANAGVLSGKKATVWQSEGPRLKAKGADYTAAKVQVDGRIITANGPEAAEEFGRAVLKALQADGQR